MDQKKKSPCHIIIKTLNIQNKERILRAAKEKDQVAFKGRQIRSTPDVTLETMKTRRSWSRIMQMLRDHGCQSRLLHFAKLSITIDGQTKIFYDKTRFNQYLVTNPALHKVPEGKKIPTQGN